MDAPAETPICAITLEELKAKGRFVARGRHRPILVVYHRDRVFACDNRCPHMGFPLHKGMVDDGILTCPWHHARFELASGGAFDLWADDVPTCPVEVRDGKVWVTPVFAYPDPAAHCRRRLEAGMAHDLDLVIAKAVQGLLTHGTKPAEILRQAVLFGVRNRDGWGTGLTILTALGRLLRFLPEDDVYLALFHGIRQVAADCAGRSPRRERAPLGCTVDRATIEHWLRRWTAVRHREAAERTLLTAIVGGTAPAMLAEILFAAETDRILADGGHSLDFINKAFECLDQIGWDHAAAVLPTVVDQIVAARGAAESTSWRQPIDLASLVDGAAAELPALFAIGLIARLWDGHVELAHSLLGDDPVAVIEALRTAIRAGASPADLGRALAYAAALRVARFGTANEHSDWETAHHAFTYCNAVHQALKRIQGPYGAAEFVDAVRGVLHGAMAIYLSRYLNVPPARLPGEDGERLDDLPSDADEIRAALLDAFDRQHQVGAAARLVARYLLLDHAPAALIATLAHTVLREDAGFHAYQMLEAGVCQLQEWGDSNQRRHILIGLARYLAAHAPTERAAYQTADIGRRLMRGVSLHEQAETD